MKEPAGSVCTVLGTAPTPDCAHPPRGVISGAITSQYLLEKSRIVFQVGWLSRPCVPRWGACRPSEPGHLAEQCVGGPVAHFLACVYVRM